MTQKDEHINFYETLYALYGKTTRSRPGTSVSWHRAYLLQCRHNFSVPWNLLLIKQVCNDWAL
jgi:hypothetical protein